MHGACTVYEVLTVQYLTAWMEETTVGHEINARPCCYHHPASVRKHVSKKKDTPKDRRIYGPPLDDRPTELTCSIYPEASIHPEKEEHRPTATPYVLLNRLARKKRIYFEYTHTYLLAFCPYLVSICMHACMHDVLHVSTICLNRRSICTAMLYYWYLHTPVRPA